jgi:RNA polymerase sigma factor (sigma-70 family)
MSIPWETFLARYRPLARNVALGITGRGEDADDLVQEAATVLATAIQRDGKRFESLEQARNYFLATVRNLALKARERTIPMQTLDDTALELPAAEDVEREIAERQMALQRALGQLPVDEQEFVRRRFLEHQTLRQIADATRTSISTLHSRERAILDRLRRILERQEGRG